MQRFAGCHGRLARPCRSLRLQGRTKSAHGTLRHTSASLYPRQTPHATHYFHGDSQAWLSHAAALPLPRARRDNGDMARFSLWQLLTFIFACCVYLAAVRSLDGLIFTNPEPQAAGEDATLIGAWLVFPILYYHWRLKASMALHLGAFACAFLLYSFDVDSGISTAEMLFATVVSGCAYSTLVSFPSAIWTIFCRSLRAGSKSD